MDMKTTGHVSDDLRALLGFIFGLSIMMVVVHVFFVSTFDLDIFQRGTQHLWHGINPWAPETAVPGFYNPPFSMLFFWPLLLINSRVIIVVGASLMFALAFYHRAWVALAWFGTHTFWWLVSAGGVDMYLVGAGLLLLLSSDRLDKAFWRLILRVLAYGLLLVKPQGGALIVLFYVLVRRDWKGALISLVLYGLLFAPLYPDWLAALCADPPISQIEASHSLAARFGLFFAAPVAALVLIARPWKYWQIGGALAGILAPYGMPGIPIFLVLTAVNSLAAIPAILIYSGCLAVLTWVAPQSPLMGIYHMGMLGLALTLACVLPARDADAPDVIDVGRRIKLLLRALWDQRLKPVR
jgi:hypothetical protein